MIQTLLTLIFIILLSHVVGIFSDWVIPFNHYVVYLVIENDH
jgi:hypothetical protein